MMPDVVEAAIYSCDKKDTDRYNISNMEVGSL